MKRDPAYWYAMGQIDNMGGLGALGPADATAFVLWFRGWSLRHKGTSTRTPTIEQMREAWAAWSTTEIHNRRSRA